MKYILLLYWLMLFNASRSQEIVSNNHPPNDYTLFVSTHKLLAEQQKYNPVPKFYCKTEYLDNVRFKKGLLRNVIYFELKLTAEAELSANINYERMIVKSIRKSNNSLWIKIGAGYGEGPNGESNILCSSLTMLSGKKNHRLESFAGMEAFYHNGDYDGWGQITGLGYRFQKPKIGFVFRAGLSVMYIQDWSGIHPGTYMSFGFGL
jgi:hypothetical protein